MNTGTLIRGGCYAGNKHWTVAEREQLCELFMSIPRPSVDVMAEKMGRTAAAIHTAVSRMGLTPPGVALRLCLPCDQMFWSTHVHNRMCRHCKTDLDLECA